ncbi:MAG: hypothetical protein ACYDBB_02120 [Armatimonadota bacterium]
MASIKAIIAQIAFQIEQMTVQNKQHEFEHMCRHIARKRICMNILPATGPVSSGGDQGRDFETLRVFVRNELVLNRTFVGLISDKSIVFACSLEKISTLMNKMKEDIRKIATQGQLVDGVYFFSSTDIDVARRHKIQQFASESFSIHVEIIDRQAIAEWLSDRDLFWIAEEYLNIPSDLYPILPPDEEDKWYLEIKEKWLINSDQIMNFQTFFEIKRVLRHSYFNEKFINDVKFWQNIIKKYIDQSDPKLRRFTMYELIVSSLRGLNNLEEYEDLIRNYIGLLNFAEEPEEIDDAINICLYLIGAKKVNALTLSDIEINQFKESLYKDVCEQLKKNISNNNRCRYLQHKGLLEVMAITSNMESSDEHKHKQIDKALNTWKKIVRIADKAPLCPIERFSDILVLLTEFIGYRKDYIELCRNVDNLLAKRIGNSKSAENARDRAIQLYKNKQVIQAIVNFTMLK